MTSRTRPRGLARRFEFKDTGPFGLRTFYMAHKSGVIIVATIVVLGLVATITGRVMFFGERFQRKDVLRSTADQQLSRRDDSELAALLHR